MQRENGNVGWLFYIYIILYIGVMDDPKKIIIINSNNTNEPFVRSTRRDQIIRRVPLHTRAQVCTHRQYIQDDLKFKLRKFNFVANEKVAEIPFGFQM